MFLSKLEEHYMIVNYSLIFIQHYMNFIIREIHVTLKTYTNRVIDLNYVFINIKYLLSLINSKLV